MNNGFTHDYLEPSQIGNFAYCKNAWHAEKVLGLRIENDDIAIGRYEHEHHWQGTAKRKEIYLVSRALKIKGKCDYVVDDNGEQVPVEIKKRRWSGPEPRERDVMQLMGIVVLLEERFACHHDHAFILYIGSRKKYTVMITMKIRDRFARVVSDMHDAMNRGVRPRYRREVKCAGCQYDEYCWTR